MHEVAYFIGGSLDPEDRRKHEKDLLDNYLDAVHKFGALKRYTLNDVWQEYRMYHMHGVGWSLTDPFIQPIEKIHAMAARHCAAAADHKTLELFESLPRYKQAHL